MIHTHSDSILKNNNNKKELFWLAAILTALVTAASIFSLLNPDVVYLTQEINRTYYPSDVGILLFGLPFLVFTSWKFYRGSFIGIILLPGALFFVLYSYALYLFGIPYGLFFWVYLLITGLSLFTLVKVLSSIDLDACRAKFSDGVSTRFASIVLISLGALILFRVIGLVSAAIMDAEMVSRLDIALWVTDFFIATPALLFVGIQLWRKKNFAFVTAPGLLLQYAVLSLGLIPVFFYQANGKMASFDMGGLIVIVVMIIFCAIPLVQLMKAITIGE